MVHAIVVPFSAHRDCAAGVSGRLSTGAVASVYSPVGVERGVLGARGENC